MRGRTMVRMNEALESYDLAQLSQDRLYFHVIMVCSRGCRRGGHIKAHVGACMHVPSTVLLCNHATLKVHFATSAVRQAAWILACHEKSAMLMAGRKRRNGT